jgi:hypothetical protein
MNAEWQFEDQALAWWNSVNPSAAASLAQMRAALLALDIQDIPDDSSKGSTFPVAAWKRAFPDFRFDVNQQLSSLDAAAIAGQSSFLPTFHLFLPLSVGFDVTSPDKGYSFLDSSIYVAPASGAYGYNYLFNKFLNAQHYTQNIDTLKYDVDGGVSALLAQKALHYLVGVEDYLRDPSARAATLNATEQAYWTAIQSRYAALPGVDESQDPLDGVTLSDSFDTGSAGLFGTDASLSFVPSPDPALGASDFVVIPSCANLISPATVANYSAIAGLENDLAPAPRSGPITLQFSSPLGLGSLLLWCDSSASLASLSYQDSQGQSHSVDLSSIVSSWIVARNADGSESLASGSAQLSSAYKLLVCNLPSILPLALPRPRVLSCDKREPRALLYPDRFRPTPRPGL